MMTPGRYVFQHECTLLARDGSDAKTRLWEEAGHPDKWLSSNYPDSCRVMQYKSGELLEKSARR
jgi:hypothetical protein